MNSFLQPVLGRTMNACKGFAFRMVSYKTTWKMTTDDVAKAVAAGDWTSYAIKVDVAGAGRTATTVVTWIKQPPQPLVELTLDTDQDFGAYITGKIKYKDGELVDPDAPNWAKQSDFNTFSRFNVNIGSSYKWTGSDLVKDVAPCDKNSVKITNTSKDTLTTGLAKLPPGDTKKRPICADKVYAAPPVKPEQNVVVYTPAATLYTKVGQTYSNCAVVQDVSSWNAFDLTKGTNFTYDPANKVWIQSV